MKREIDILIVNNCPSFYKINLYNQIAERVRLHVIFIGLTDQVVINSDYKKDIRFSYDLLSEIQIEKRNKIKSVFKLYQIIKGYSYQKIIYGGYVDIEVRCLIWITPQRKNCLQFESSIKESKITGIYSIAKRLILSRFSVVMPAGLLQREVITALKFSGKVVDTHGVGIFNKAEKYIDNSSHSSELRYLYVGRLIDLKNLELIVNEFNDNGKRLTIIGTGEKEYFLRQMAKENILFLGFIPNNMMYKLYMEHDIFILPSFSETWGLVVEEAIYFGLPALVSDAVGCQYDMIISPQTGLIFSPYDKDSLSKAIGDMEKNFFFYKKNCLNFDFDKRDLEQVNVYVNLVAQ